MTRIGAVIPAHQAAPSVGAVVRATLEVLPDVIVIDDGSGDGTADRAREAGAEVHVLPANQGKGTALGTAFDILMARGFTGVRIAAAVARARLEASA